MEADFPFVQKLVGCLSDVQVHLIPDTREEMLSLVGKLFYGMAPDNQTALLLERAMRTLKPGCIYQMEGALRLRCTVCRFESTGHLLVLGPCREAGTSEAEILSRLRQRNIPGDAIPRLLVFFRQQPVLSWDRLYTLSQVLVQQLSGTAGPIACQRLDLGWDEDEQARLLNLGAGDELSQVRNVELRYTASAVMTEAVKQGNLSLALRFIQRLHTIPLELMRSANTLRNAQNMCIILNTQLRHAMGDQGIHPYRLDQISGAIARQIELLKSEAAVHAYFAQILRQYCELAQEKHQQGLPAFSRLAVAYIHTHLPENLTVKAAAKAMLVNPDYLSARFRREVGIPFIAYVNRERVRQAAALLRRTELQVQQIASVVGYNHTSYFAKQFVRFQGVTPSDYRSRG